LILKIKILRTLRLILLREVIGYITKSLIIIQIKTILLRTKAARWLRLMLLKKRVIKRLRVMLLRKRMLRRLGILRRLRLTLLKKTVARRLRVKLIISKLSLIFLREWSAVTRLITATIILICLRLEKTKQPRKRPGWLIAKRARARLVL
jgi:hypothetical protein